MKTIFGAVLLIFSTIVFSAENMTINVDKNSKVFMVSLSANPSTGFEWTVYDYDKNILKLKDMSFKASQTSRVGAPGIMNFTFEIINTNNLPKHSEIFFNYSRAWEKNTSELQKVTINFN